MSEAGFASLGPSLLARKGGAKPAMRPQVAPMVEEDTLAAVDEEQLEDLGWNDMGEPEDAQAGADIVPITAAVMPAALATRAGPIVRRQQKRLEERVLADAAMTGPEDREPEYDAEDEELYGDDAASSPVSRARLAAEVAAPAPAVHRPRVPAAAAGRRAAFTLRLDAERHLKLRLAATMQGVSAQVLVTEALDRLLAEYGELDAIASHLKRH